MASAKAVAFLSKKSWHTGTMRSMEKVWKAENKHKEEDAKMAELRKELMEEREMETLRRQQEKALGQERKERLDFLYDVPMAAMEAEFDINKRYVDPDKNSEVKQLKEKPGSLFIEKTEGDNLTDMRMKIREDPLFQIKKEQQTLKKQIRDNPIKMKELKEQILRQKLKEELGSSGSSKRKRGDDHVKRESKKRKTEVKHEVKEERDNDHYRKVKDERDNDHYRKVKDERDDSFRKVKKEEEEKPFRDDRRRRDDRDDRRNDRDGRRDDRDDRRDDRKRDRDNDRRREERDDRRDDYRRRDDRRDDRRKEDRRDDRDDKRREVKEEKRRDERVKEEKPSSSRRKMTHEERLKLVEEMEVDGKQQREERVTRIQQRLEDREKERDQTRASLVEASKTSTLGGPQFLTNMSKSVYEDGSTASVSDRIHRSKHTIQRTHLDTDRNTYK